MKSENPITRQEVAKVIEVVTLSNALKPDALTEVVYDKERAYGTAKCILSAYFILY